MNRPALIAFSVALSVATGSLAGATQAPQDKATEIRAVIRTLRKLPDDERATVTKRLALEIRELPASPVRLQLASSLANLSTEGDFGRDTLQEVTTTLTEALVAATPEKPAEIAAYAGQLAQLKKYEGMRVPRTTPGYGEAMKELDRIDAERAKADFTLTDLTGKSWTRSSLQGKVVLVNFWATWCPPCKKELPDLDALYRQFEPKGLVVLAISDEKLDTVTGYLKAFTYSFPFLSDPDGVVAKRYGVEGIPKSFIYDRRGRMVAQTIDMRTRGQFLQLLAKAGLR